MSDAQIVQDDKIGGESPAFISCDDDEKAFKTQSVSDSNRPERFLFEFDRATNLTSLSLEFEQAFEVTRNEILHISWQTLSDRLSLDPGQRIARSLDTRAIWKETIFWPLNRSDAPSHLDFRAPIALTAMPVFDRNRQFQGFRGFGIIEWENVASHADADATEKTPNLENSEANERDQWDAFIATLPFPFDRSHPVDLGKQLSTKAAYEDDDQSFHPAHDQEAISPLSTTRFCTHDHNNVASSNISSETKSTPSNSDEKTFQRIASALRSNIQSGELDHRFDAYLEGSSGRSPDQRSVSLLDETTLPVIRKMSAGAARNRTLAKGLGAGAAAILEKNACALERRHENRQADQSNGGLSETRSSMSEWAFAEHALNSSPIALIVLQHQQIVFANEAALDLLCYKTIRELAADGGLERLLIDTNRDGDEARFFSIMRADRASFKARIQLKKGTWHDKHALFLALLPKERLEIEQVSGFDVNSQASTKHITDLLDNVFDGIIITNDQGIILRSNSNAQTLFGHSGATLNSLCVSSLFDDKSKRGVVDSIKKLCGHGVLSVPNDGCEVTALKQTGEEISLFLTMGRLEVCDTGLGPHILIVLRDITRWRQTERELVERVRHAERASARKSNFLAKLSHEIRTPLNTIFGFADIMMKEQIGPIGNLRYRDYARNIYNSSEHIISILNDLLDLSKIEAGKQDLRFEAVDLNDLFRECVSTIELEAKRGRIIIRTSFDEALPHIVADTRSIRQIALNVLSNAVKFTDTGGQVIVSTTYEHNGEVCVRIRDTGVGMSYAEVDVAMEPFCQVNSDVEVRNGTGIGLPLTRALAKANFANFEIDSKRNYGTLVRISFPNERVLEPKTQDVTE